MLIRWKDRQSFISLRPLKVLLLLLLLWSSGSRGLAETEAQTAKWGYVNAKGKLVIKPQFTNALSFSEGLAVVKLDVKDNGGSTQELCGYIDKTGNLQIQPQFSEAGRFADGLAAVKIPSSGPLVEKLGEDSKDQWGYIDKSGKFAIQPQFSGADIFSDGLASVRSSDLWGYIDESGEFVIKPKYATTWKFSGGLAPVLTWTSSGGMFSVTGEDDTFTASGNHTWCYIDKTGKEVMDHQSFDGVGNFSDNLAPVALGVAQGTVTPDHWGFMDKSGTLVIKPQFSQVHAFSEGLAAVQTGTWKDIGQGFRSWIVGKWGYIDPSGKLVIEPQYDGADPFSQGMAAVLIDGRWGYIDKTGKVIIKPQFVGNRAFAEELAPVLVSP